MAPKPRDGRGIKRTTHCGLPVSQRLLELGGLACDGAELVAQPPRLSLQ